MVQSDQFEAHCRTYFVPNEGRSLSSVRFSPFETKISLGYVNGQFVVYDYLKEGQVFAIRLHD